MEMHQTGTGLEHPVAIEILSLRDALTQQQHATHRATIQVQNYASEVSAANKKARQLGAEISTLRAELDLLRAPRPVASPSPAEAELTLALRRANSRLEETQNQLLEANTSVAHALGERERTSDEVSEAYRLLEAARAQEVELRTTLAERDIEKRAYELALGEYAALVRDLEKREGAGGAHLNLKEAVAAGDIERIKELTTEVARSKADIESLRAQLDVEQRAGESERIQLAGVRTELRKREADDRSAAALVERYMKFSQHHTDVLQRALNDQSMRHSATVASLSQHAENIERALAAESARIKQLQSSVDNLVEDLARESSGRRREIRIRLALAGRTAKIEEDLRRWERRIREHPRPQSQQSSDLLFGLQELEQFRDIVNLLGAPLVFRDAAIPDSEDDALPGPLARVLAAEIAVEGLTTELERETARRIELERERAQLPPVPTLEKPTYKLPDSKEKIDASSAMIPSASVSIVSLQSSSGLSLATTETSTSISLDDDDNVLAVPIALPAAIEPPQAPPEPVVDEASVVMPAPTAPPTSLPVEPPPVSSLTFPSNPSPPPEPVKIVEPQSVNDNTEVQALLSQLPRALQRYTPLQNTFRDCHVTLAALRSELRQRPRSPLLTAVERLYDYNEDARVEIEIRIADEARKAHGFETMLQLSLDNNLGDLRAFVDGSAPDIRKALETAERKRNELEHDIAAIKVSLYAPEAETGAVAEVSASQPPPSPLWGRKMSLGPGLLGTGRPLLRRVGSGTLGHSRASSLGGEDHSEMIPKDPLAGLGLKIPMPNMVSSPLPSPMKAGSPLVLERTRVTSMYRIGLGSSRLDLSNRSMTVTPTSRADEESDDGVE
ncbi:unnamed protein product [Rhizoctonia solani]|uniref:Uncharacterized protein n=1 Tax=Rhizoctonia solani TaxID=456999 RepID=A0A8H3HG86_9AGAM|nr:unnamed protein product [Rhizoctonia solani]